MKLFNFFGKFRFSVGGHFAFRKMVILALVVFSGSGKTKVLAKFGENRTSGSGVIQVFVNFKMAAGGHLVLQI